MTVQVNDRRKEYIGNGVATTYNGPRAFLKAQIQVYKGPDGVYALVPDTQYEISGLGTSGTTVVFDTAPALNDDILILRTVVFDQPTDVTNLGQFLPEIHENAFDYRCFQIQQLVDGAMQMEFDSDTGTFVWNAKGARLINLGDGINLNDAINLGQAYGLLETGSGGVSVSPKYWEWEGDGELDNFPISGADIDNPLFYDSAMEMAADNGDFIVLRPFDDFTITFTGDADETRIQFTTPPAVGVRGFTTLRGYARPFAGDPITTVNPTIINIEGDTLIDNSMRNSVLEVDSPTDVVLTIRENTGAAVDWADGDFWSARQIGDGKVTVVMEDAGTLTPSPGFLSETRGVGSIMSLTCMDPDTSNWAASGDLLRETEAPVKLVIPLADRAALIATNITAATGKFHFVMPFDFVLDSVADGGIYASLSVAQAAGNIVTVDVNRNGTSILATKLTIDNAEKTSKTAATPAVYASGGNLLSAGDEITGDVDQIGTALAKGLTVYLVGERAS